MAVEPKLMTAEELLRLPNDNLRNELVMGELRTMSPTGFEHGGTVIVFGGSLDSHVRMHRLGRVVGEVGFKLTTDPDTVRAPDVAFVRRERLPDSPVRGYWPGAPDLVVEVISPNDLYTEVDEKVAEWLEHGTLVVFVVNPRRKVVAVHRPKQPVVILGIEDILDAEDVVPGWSLAVRDLFDDQ